MLYGFFCFNMKWGLVCLAVKELVWLSSYKIWCFQLIVASVRWMVVVCFRWALFRISVHYFLDIERKLLVNVDCEVCDVTIEN